MLKSNIHPTVLSARRKYLARTGRVIKREGSVSLVKLPIKSSNAV